GSHQHHAWTNSLCSLNGVEGFFQRAYLLAGEVAQFELVGRDNIGDGHDLIAQQRWDFIGDKATGLLIAHHRVAGIQRVGVDFFYACYGIHDGAGDIRAALVAGNNRINVFEYAAAANPVNNAGDIISGYQRAAPITVAGVIGEINGVHGPHFMADTLQWEHSCRVTDMAKCNVRLDLQYIHARHITPVTGYSFNLLRL